jgi:hypothetical protein
MISIEKFGDINYGRFGNQLFQYSLAKILSLYHNCSFYLNPSESFLSFFDINKLTYNKIQSSINNYRYIEKDPFIFDSTIFNHKKIDIIGFFQNLDYYTNYLTEIKKELIPNKKQINKAFAYIKDHRSNKNKPITAIHVRRTDYSILKSKHGFLDYEYYKNILIQFNLLDSHIFILSDDIQTVKNEFSDLNLITNVTYVDMLDSCLDFYIMYLCNNQIIANSTFSWWASLLSDADNVYIPYNWIGNSHAANTAVSPQDINLYPLHWHKINIQTYNNSWRLLFQ